MKINILKALDSVFFAAMAGAMANKFLLFTRMGKLGFVCQYEPNTFILAAEIAMAEVFVLYAVARVIMHLHAFYRWIQAGGFNPHA